MGRIIRRFAQFHQMDITNRIASGTWAVPIAQAAAGPEYGIQVVKTAIALGGEVAGGYFGTVATVARAGAVVGTRIRATVDTNVVLTGALRGIHTELEMLGTTAQITGVTEGHVIEIYSEAGCVHTSDIRGVFLSNSILGTVGGRYDFLRLQENGSALLNSLIYAVCGGTSDISYFMELSPGSRTGWNNVGDRIGGGAPNANAAGWLRLLLAGVGDRYIQLFT